MKVNIVVEFDVEVLNHRNKRIIRNDLRNAVQNLLEHGDDDGTLEDWVGGNAQVLDYKVTLK